MALEKVGTRPLVLKLFSKSKVKVGARFQVAESCKQRRKLFFRRLRALPLLVGRRRLLQSGTRQGCWYTRRWRIDGLHHCCNILICHAAEASASTDESGAGAEERRQRCVNIVLPSSSWLVVRRLSFPSPTQAHILVTPYLHLQSLTEKWSKGYRVFRLVTLSNNFQQRSIALEGTCTRMA